MKKIIFYILNIISGFNAINMLIFYTGFLFFNENNIFGFEKFIVSIIVFIISIGCSVVFYSDVILNPKNNHE